MNIQHHFKNTCYDIDTLLTGCNKLSTFMTRLEKQGNLYPHRFEYNVYVGDGFECLIEAIINLSPIDKRLNIHSYTPINGNDMGVDGSGIAHDGSVHTIQVKYRSNTDQVLTANKDHISNFVAHSFAAYDAKFMTIYTTAKELHNEIANSMYNNKVKVIGVKELRAIVDNNDAFWSMFHESLKA